MAASLRPLFFEQLNQVYRVTTAVNHVDIPLYFARYRFKIWHQGNPGKQL